MTHFVGGPMHGALVPIIMLGDYLIMVGPVHYMRRVASCGRVDFVIYGMAEWRVEELLAEIYSTEDV